ncbi:MAG TPA: prepilin-type N-terminal cleavage/methylation domain-containing protein [Gammaproteobacteria bacterium]|nr:prepilin-type N-terminal cleavage/methylation domain-containing protein [Gammaproteobacteria bacterium]
MKNQQGLTLIELMTTIAIVAVLAAVAIPSFTSMTAQNRMVGGLNDLVADLHYARSEAIKRGRNVVVCIANRRFSNCRSGSADWSLGWIVRDPGDSTVTPRIRASVLRVHAALDGDDSMTETDKPSGASSGKITFSRNGFSTDARTIKMCEPTNTASKARAFIITTTGHIHTGYDSDDDGIVESGSGDNVTCS